MDVRAERPFVLNRLRLAAQEVVLSPASEKVVLDGKGVTHQPWLESSVFVVGEARLVEVHMTTTYQTVDDPDHLVTEPER